MACLDTTFLIDLLRGNPEIEEIKEEVYAREIILSVAAPSVMELWTGACLARTSEKEKEKIIELIESLEILNLDEKSARESGEIEAELLRKGISIETEDVMIAGIAIANGEKVITRDQHYARIPKLKVLKY